MTPPNNRLQALRQRRRDPTVKTTRINEVYDMLKEPEAITYLISAIQPIDAEVTQLIISEAKFPSPPATP